MRHLPPPVRDKAVAIANALLAAGHDEGAAIRMGIAGAKRWYDRQAHGMWTRDDAPGCSAPEEAATDESDAVMNTFLRTSLRGSDRRLT
jgi:uncharacterized protein YdaT